MRDILPTYVNPKVKEIMHFAWSFEQKSSPAGELIKHEVRLCAHGRAQKGKDYNNAFAPEVNWITMQSLFTISIVSG